MRPKDIFNKLLWDERMDAGDYQVTFIHRGAPGDKKSIPAIAVTKAGRSWFIYHEEGDILIPYHRILEVRNIKTGEILWRKIGRSKDA